MKKYIVTTTINSPTKATFEFCKKPEWQFIIVGDISTPHEEYRKLEHIYENVTYLSPEMQEKNYPKISKLLGWRSIQRRNIGFIHAYKEGADIIATVDDDNIPNEKWGKKLYIGKTITLDCYRSENGVFDPLSVTNDNYVWHRGYPIELLKTRGDIKKTLKVSRKVLIQADLWNGDPDIDAIARLTFKPIVDYSYITRPYCSIDISPFNSQNTFLSREVIPYYMVLPFIGRMDDIWGGYIVQKYFPESLIYNEATVYQDRNEQDLIKNLENEIIGYRNTLNFIKNIDSYEKLLSKETLKAYQIYRSYFSNT